MQYQLPQFIYRDPKIVGPLTFKQFLYVGGAGLVAFVLYLILGKRSFLLFIFLAGSVFVGSLFLAFGQVSGRSVPATINNFLFYSFSKKLYLWKKKETQFKIVLHETPELKNKRKDSFEPSLRIAEKSRLKGLSTEIETKK